MSYWQERAQASFDRAQRAYDRQMPPESTYKDCLKCEGLGVMEFSNCCEAEVINGHCAKCHEVCGYAECKECEGSGCV